MTLVVICPGCEQRFSAPESLAGKRVSCPKCNAPIDIPLPDLPLAAIVPADDFAAAAASDPLANLSAADLGGVGRPITSAPLAALSKNSARRLASLGHASGGIFVGLREWAWANKGSAGILALALCYVGLHLLRNRPVVATVVGFIGFGFAFLATKRDAWNKFTTSIAEGFGVHLRLIVALVSLLILGPLFALVGDKMGAGVMVILCIRVPILLFGLGAGMLAFANVVRRIPTSVALAAVYWVCFCFFPSWMLGNSSYDEGVIVREPFDLAGVPIRSTGEAAGEPIAVGHIRRSRYRLNVPPGEPGSCSRVDVLMPYEEGLTYAAKSLPCVMFCPAGTTLINGQRLGDDDWDEVDPYVEAGFIVVAYEQDGQVGNIENVSDEELRRAYAQFSKSRAGLVNARNALEFALANVPEIDPTRIYTAGHSSAGTMALLLTIHEPRVAGCVAYAPVSDIEEMNRPVKWVLNQAVPGCWSLMVRESFRTHEQRLTQPLFLFHASDDDVVPVSQTEQTAARLRSAGKDVTVSIVPTGGHHQAMARQGLSQGVQWLKNLDAKRIAATGGPRAAPTRAVAEKKPEVDPLAAVRARVADPLGYMRESERKNYEPAKELVAWSAAPDPPLNQTPAVVAEWRVSDGFSGPRVVEVADEGASVLLQMRRDNVPVLSLYDLTSGQVKYVVADDKSPLRTSFARLKSSALSPLGEYLAERKMGDNAISIVPLANQGKRQSLPLKTSLNAWVRFLDDRRLLTIAYEEYGAAGKQAQLSVTNLADGTQAQGYSVFVDEAADVPAMALSPGARYLAVPRRNRVQLLELASGKVQGELASPPAASGGVCQKITGIAFSPDGKQIAVLFEDREVLFWNLEQGKPIGHHVFQYSVNLDGPDRSAPIQYLPGGKHWLFYERLVTPCLAGEQNWVLMPEKGSTGTWSSELRVYRFFDAQTFLAARRSTVALARLPSAANNTLANLSSPTSMPALYQQALPAELASKETDLVGAPRGFLPPGGLRGQQVADSDRKALPEFMRKVYEDFVVSNDAAQMRKDMHWWPSGRRPVIGLRWGMGITAGGGADPPNVRSEYDYAQLTGNTGKCFAKGLKDRMSSGALGAWNAGPLATDGIALVGSDTRNALVDIARDQGLDLLLLMELSVHITGLGKNREITMRTFLVDVTTGKDVWASTSLSSTSTNAVATKYQDTVLSHIDECCVLQDMPAITPEQAQRRAASLVKSPPSMPNWETLVELRYYQAQKLLSEDEAAELFEKLLGPGNGKNMATGTPELRREILRAKMMATGK